MLPALKVAAAIAIAALAGILALAFSLLLSFFLIALMAIKRLALLRFSVRLLPPFFFFRFPLAESRRGAGGIAAAIAAAAGVIAKRICFNIPFIFYKTLV